jgi:small subunit ribosomal protein S17
MADKNPTPGADMADEAEETPEAATAVEAPSEVEATSETAAQAGGETSVEAASEDLTPEVAAPEKTAATAKSAAPTKAAAPAKAAKSAAPAKAAAAKAAASAKPAAKTSKVHARRPGEPSAADGAAEPRTGRRKVREGIVISNSMEKTAVVAIIERVRHPRYAKTVQRTKRLYAHDEANDTRVGDRVRLSETRPLSKLKRWRVEQVLERAR